MATAWLAGGSGLVGGVLLRRLLRDDHFDKVTSVGRRVLPIQDPKLVQVEPDGMRGGPMWADTRPE